MTRVQWHMHVGVTNDKGAAYSVRVTDHEISHKQKMNIIIPVDILGT